MSVEADLRAEVGRLRREFSVEKATLRGDQAAVMYREQRDEAQSLLMRLAVANMSNNELRQRMELLLSASRVGLLSAEKLQGELTAMLDMLAARSKP